MVVTSRICPSNHFIEVIGLERLYPRCAIAAVAIVLIKDNKILLVKRGYPPGLGKWSVPGGVIEAGERLVEAAKRELKEETGIEAEPLGVLWVLNNIVYDGEGRVLYHYLVVDILFDPATVRGEMRPGGDVVDVSWFDINEVLGLPDVSRTTKRLIMRIHKHGLVMIPIDEVDHISVQR